MTDTMTLAQPGLLSKINERQVLNVLQVHGPLSRAEVARCSGLSAPTVSKAVASLLASGLLEENEVADLTRGRPAKKLRLANQNAQVIGIVLDADECRVAVAGLDGALDPERQRALPTPASYAALLDGLAELCGDFMERPGMATRGIGVSMPGLIDYRRKCGVLSPNLPLTNGRSPGVDLADRLGVACALLQESHALCLAERQYGLAQGRDDFAMLDVSTGIGMGVMSGGRLLTGHNGLAGEIGHITVVEDGKKCGCGNRGCLETVAGDAAFAWRVSQRLGRKVGIDEAVARAQDRKEFAEELAATCRYLAIGVAAVINLFNPATLFIHGRLFEADETLFDQLIELTGRRALAPSFAECHIVQARGSKLLGAVAGAIQYLTSSIAPTLKTDAVYAPATNQSSGKRLP